MRKALANTNEAISEIDKAANELYKSALDQCSIFKRQRAIGGTVPDKALFHMRKALIDLFAFYKRNNILERNDVFERFGRLHREVPELWDNNVEENKQLIDLTHPLLEKVTLKQSEIQISKQPSQVQPGIQKSPLSIEIATSDQSLSHGNSEILLPLRVSHRGSGEASDIMISVTGLQSEQKPLVSKRKERLDSLEQGQTRAIDIPVDLNPVPGQGWLECRVDLIYRWDGQKLSTSHPLKIPFKEFKSRDREAKKRVGLFVDYENAYSSVGRKGHRELGEALITYASGYGEVICPWAIAHPQNLKDTDFETELEQASFKIRIPYAPQSGKVPKDASDSALIAQILEEIIKTEPDIYIIVSGDGYYYEAILTLINNGKTVILCGPHQRLAEKYRDLRKQKHSSQGQVEGNKDVFFIDDFETVLRLLEQQEARV